LHAGASSAGGAAAGATLGGGATVFGSSAAAAGANATSAATTHRADDLARRAPRRSTTVDNARDFGLHSAEHRGVTQPSTNLPARLVALTEDAFFFVASTGRLDVDGLHAFAARRVDQPGSAQGMEAWDAWVHGLCVAIAPIAAPRWLPMADAVLAGLSLEHGARGIRGLFTSKPSDKDVARVRDIGRFAARTLGAVLSATGNFRFDARATRGTFIAALGLPDADRAALDAEDPRPAELVDVPAGVEPKIAAGVVRGAFLAAMSDGLDPREEAAVLTIARKLGLDDEAINAARADAKRTIDGSKGFGEATVEAIRYMLEGEPLEAERFAIAAARLILPSIHRRESVTAINQGGQVTLGRHHEIDKKQREPTLALAWISVLRTNPTLTTLAERARRHAAVAKDLGAEADAAPIRAALDQYVETELQR
jgi:hypothetical protein